MSTDREIEIKEEAERILQRIAESIVTERKSLSDIMDYLHRVDRFEHNFAAIEDEDEWKEILIAHTAHRARELNKNWVKFIEEVKDFKNKYPEPHEE